MLTHSRLFGRPRPRPGVRSRRNDRRWFRVLIFGFLWYAGIPLLWYLAALYILPNPGPEGG